MMQSRHSARKHKRKSAKFLALSLGLSVAAGSYAHAASDTWDDGGGDDAWTNPLNWVSDTNVPGLVGGTTSSDIATFGATGAGPVTVDANRNIFGIDFADTIATFTLSGGPLILSNTGYIQATGGGAGHTDTVSAGITLAGNASIINNSSTATRVLSVTGGITGVAGGASILTLDGTNTSTGNAVNGILANGTTGTLAVVKNGTGNWSMSNAGSTFTGGVTINAGVLRTSQANGLGTGTTTLAGGTLNIATASTLASTITGTGTVTYSANANTLSSTYSGAGPLTLVNANGVGSVVVDFLSGTFTSYTGKATLSNNNVANGSFRLNSATAYAGTINTWFDLVDTTILQRRDTNAANDTVNLGSLSGAAGATLNISGSSRSTNWSIGARGDNTTFAGVITNSFDNVRVSRITKVGTGTLTLTGANTYTGGTTVSNGTLATSGTGTFGGGSVTLQGTTPVTLTLGSAVSFADNAVFTFAANSTINMDFSGNDTLAGITNGTLTIGAGTYNAAALNSFFGGTNFVDLGTAGETLTVIPEPSSWAMVMGGVGMLLGFQRSRRRSA